jgi:uncharacterized protein YyaL (SSP411 family)
MNEHPFLELLKNKKNHLPNTRHWTSAGNPKYTNALIQSSSPYLLQHAHNPVDWRMWGSDAFNEAHSLDRPIFLSVGYSTCHWCHVMERESFEDEEIAEWLNTHFIPIKVDREERPDIDSVYMDFAQITTGKGGWPLNVFLTPAKRPLFAGTYFPPRDGDRDVKIGFLSYLKIMSHNWKDPKLQSQSEHPIEILRHYAIQPPEAQLSTQWIEEAANEWIHTFDEDWGGFTQAPKFPRPAMLETLLRAWHRSGEATYLHAVEITLERMYCGGIYDHIGGGFARYSVDNRWWVPHFEKMLYDQAQLIHIYLECFQVTRNAFYAYVARDLLGGLIRDFKSDQGGFYTALDAESLNDQGETQEGYYYTWTHQELQDLCTEEELVWIEATFGIIPEGNFDDGRNLFRLYEPLDEEELKYWTPIRLKLYQARQKRISPMRDEKIICAWNAMAASALSKAAAILGEPQWLTHAQDVVDFIMMHLWKDQRIHRSWCAGDLNPIEGVLEDYMGTVCALLDVFEVSGSAHYLEYALSIYESAERFFDPKRGGFYRCSEEHRTDLPYWEKPLIDGAEPSGNAWAALAALRLHHLTDQPHYRAQAQSTLKAIASLMKQQPTACPKALSALNYSYEGRSQVVLIQLPQGESPLLNPLTRAAWLPFHPYSLRLSLRVINQELKNLLPTLKDKESTVDHPISMICSTQGCTPPISTPADLRAILAKL